MRSRRLVQLFPLLLLALPARAAFCSVSDGGPRHEFEFFAGYSPVSATLIGSETDRRLALAGFSYQYRCWIFEKASVSFAPAVLPVATLFQPAQELAGPFFQKFSPAHSVYGFGVAPIGFTVEFVRARRIHPFFETIGGLIASTEPIPENQPDATGLNFLFDFGAGVRWNAGDRHVVTLGYRFLHISNAYTSGFNPGVDNNVFYAGFSFLR